MEKKTWSKMRKGDTVWVHYGINQPVLPTEVEIIDIKRSNGRAEFVLANGDCFEPTWPVETNTCFFGITGCAATNLEAMLENFRYLLKFFSTRGPEIEDLMILSTWEMILKEYENEKKV